MNSHSSQGELVQVLEGMEEQVSSLKSLVDLLPKLYCFKVLSPATQSVVKEQMSVIQEDYKDISHFILVSQLNLLCQKPSEGTDSAWNYSEPRNNWLTGNCISVEQADLNIPTNCALEYNRSNNKKKNYLSSGELSSKLSFRSPPHLGFNSFQNEFKSISFESRFPSLFKGSSHILLENSNSSRIDISDKKESLPKDSPIKQLKLLKSKSRKLKFKPQQPKSILYMNHISDLLTARNTRRGKRYIFNQTRKNIQEFNAELKKCLPKLGYKRGCVLSYSKIRDIALSLNRMRDFKASIHWFKKFCKCTGYKIATRVA